MRRFATAAAVVAMLAAAGATGAIAVDNFTDVDEGQWARLDGKNIYCEAFVLASGTHRGEPAFDCAAWRGNVRYGNSYSAEIGDWGIKVDRWDAGGRKYRTVYTYGNG